ncbi:MAG: hypothetical protein AAF614_29010 [Chloroflexota bacterium]
MILVREQLSWVKWLTVVWAVYAIVWISLEGMLWQVVMLGWGTTAVLLLHFFQRYLAERSFVLLAWLGITAVLGLIWGSSSVLFTLLSMAVKTGLHAHGPEFTPAEIEWVLGQALLWSLVGLLCGVGLGLLVAAQAKR